MRKNFKFMVAGALWVMALAAMGYHLYARRAASEDSPGGQQRVRRDVPVQDDLRQLMQSRLHEDYTLMSYTIWHDKPLSREKMDTIAAASARVTAVARGLDVYEPGYQQQGWSSQDVKFFDDKRLQLASVAEELGRAAQKHDATQVLNFFMHLDTTCQSCHKRFRPDLAWN